MLMLAWRLLVQRRAIGLPAALFLPLSLCVAGFVIGNTPTRAMVPGGPAGALAHMLSGFTVIFLWWFCLSCFDSRFRLRGGVLGVGLVWAALAALDRGLGGAALADAGLSRLLVFLGLAIVGHLVWRLLAERRDDLIERRHDARILVTILLGGMLFIDLAADGLLGFTWRPLWFAMTQNAMILAFGLWLAGRLLTVRADVLRFGIVAGDPPAPGEPAEYRTARDEMLHRHLSRLMKSERIFLDPELTFASFAERMGAPERVVRRFIHQELGHDHFRGFLNQYRVEEARRLLAERGDGDKLIAIALDSGFASLASFNRVFRMVEGRTPSEYRIAIRREPSSDRIRTMPAFEEGKGAF